MSGFSVEWLTLRESHDRRARNPFVLDAVTSLFKSKNAVRITDLACGTGSTSRTLGPRLPARQHWDLVDNDPRLLQAASSRKPSNDCSLSTIQLDLNGDFEAGLKHPADLMTTSALLDLVSEPWLDRFVRHVAARALPVYAALTYDGRIELSPVDPADAAISAAVNAHQRTDKGFGPALGPSAAGAAISRFEKLGYAIVQGPSDWVIGTDDQAIQIELLDGWASAAREIGSLPGQAIDDWLLRRKAAVERRVSTMRVGHVDFVATPSSTR
jgi:hypothetical protein